MRLRKIIASMLIITVSALSASTYEHELAVATIFQDEAPYLREWIEYHKLMGATKFYLYNNLSQDNYFEVLEPYIESGQVELIEWPYESTNIHDYRQIQTGAYDDALVRTIGKVKWLMVIDTDEFFVPRKDSNLINFLAKYEKKKKIGGLEAVWVYFGTSGVKKIPDDKLLIETILLNKGPSPSSARRHHKSIVRPERVASFPNAHNADYVTGYSYKRIDCKKLQVNHYWIRDEDYLYRVKIPRREKWGFSAQSTIAQNKRMNENNAHSQAILRFIQPLKNRMQDFP